MKTAVRRGFDVAQANSISRAGPFVYRRARIDLAQAGKAQVARIFNAPPIGGIA